MEQIKNKEYFLKLEREREVNEKLTVRVEELEKAESNPESKDGNLLHEFHKKVI